MVLVQKGRENPILWGRKNVRERFTIWVRHYLGVLTVVKSQMVGEEITKSLERNEQEQYVQYYI